MKRIIRLIRKANRAKRVKDLAQTKFDTVVYSCANVSRSNNSLSFVISRTGAFGVPKIEPIQRPDVVILSESNDCVVIKDGKIYELKTWS